MAPQWAAFVGLTGLVLTAFLGLAWISQQLITEQLPLSEQVTPAGVDPSISSTPQPVSTSTATSPAGVQSVSTGALLANVAVTQGLFGVVLVGGAAGFAIPAWAFGLGNDALTLTNLGWGVGLGVGLWLASEFGSRVVDAAGIEYDEGLRELLAPDSRGGWVVLLGLVLPVIAGVEELVFRGAAIGVVAAGLNVSPWTMAVVSSFGFAMGHGAQGRAGIVVTGMLGFVLATAYVLTGSLLTVIVAHYLVNALEFVVHEGLGIAE
ncbi:CPBP family intramembrane glutamic endopeptidase [Halapricum salinum]|uniref:CPBP family intramembrane metalloprotease n=1 Tax=Halapricum salinum TaxID=1457250 RepID=A0A4D6H9K6_9EURY|nr:CPBP family intramembrane glutamic endopeptidase [Halapricum salinum]QCC50480.1 CPBP family intramembrane metalloprotease [Halapricum salinum]